MAFAVENGKVGSLVWVQRKNGTWWPRKIEFSSFTSRTAVKLLGRESGSVEWFNLEKSKRVKAFRSVEFDDFIRSVESSKTSHCKKSAKYVHREDAILHALLLEKQEQEKGHKRPGNVNQGALCRAKRSRCAYLPIESNNYVKHSILHSRSQKFSSTSCETEENSDKSSIGEEQASSESTASSTSESSFEDSDSNGDSQLTGSYTSGTQTRIRNAQTKESRSNSSRSSPDSECAGGAAEQNWNLKEKCYSQIHQGQLTLDADCQEESRIRYKFAKKSCKQLALEVFTLSNSTSGAENSGAKSLCCGPVYTNLQNTIKTMLVDVVVTVQANYRKERVPLVSLMSKLNKAAIIGHPVEVEVLVNIPEDLMSRKGCRDHMIDNGGNKIHQLAWRTSKRSPVCYIPIHNSSATSNPEAKKSVVVPAEESLLKPLTKGNFSTENGHDLLISGQISEGVSFKKGAGNTLSKATCVPVNLIFSKLFSAIST